MRISLRRKSAGLIYTEGFSSREIAEQLIPSVARKTHRKPDADSIAALAKTIMPASKSHTEQLSAMRKAASTLRRANSDEMPPVPTPRRISISKGNSENN